MCEDTDTVELPVPDQAAPGPGQGHLQPILEMLSQTPAVRDELVQDIQQQINLGTYLSDEKLNLAIYRLLKDILR